MPQQHTIFHWSIVIAPSSALWYIIERMQVNYHHPEARQMPGRSFGLDAVVDRLSVLTLSAARPIGWHTHAETEILCCLKGNLEYEFEGHAKVSLHSGCHLVVPAGNRHRLTGGMDGPCRRLSFYLKPARRHLDGLAPFTGPEYGAMLGDILKRSFRPRAFPPSANLPRIADLADGRKLTARERVELRILTANALLGFASTISPTHDIPNTRIMAEAIRWLENHYAEKVTIDQLTTFMGYGKSRLFTLFRDLTGLSPIEWLNQFRVDKAAVLLADRTLSVQQVCRAVGFQSQAFFAKMFHRYKGLPPSRYRLTAPIQPACKSCP